MQETWANFAKTPGIDPGWNGGDLRHFRGDGKSVVDSSALLDRNCDIYKELYEGRA
jgi:hypothetical protein